MRSFLVAGTFAAAAASATPFLSRSSATTGKSVVWQPAAGTKTDCDKTTGIILSSSIASQLEAIINNACAAMMPVCAFPDRIDPETMCIQTIDWPLSGRKTSSIPASLNLGDGDHSGGWQVQFEVVPPAQGEDSVGAHWTVQDCYGYFSSMLEQAVPIGCRRPQGFGFGRSTVGGSPFEFGGGSALAGTKFTVSIDKTA